MYSDMDLLDQIKEEIKIQNVGLIVVGQPVDYNGGSSEVLEAIDNFRDKLIVSTELEVVLFDENYSSKEAMRVMLASGKKKKDRRKKGNLDMTAAAVILKNFIREND